ncbi:MAG: cation transporter, partial [Bacteroidota bacterium]|nr:cation transporter [Bacteroidota bacterium]
MSENPAIDNETLVFPIEGMTCASCAMRVERALQRVSGVLSAEVNLATQKATVTFDPARTGAAELAEAVSAAGYRLHEPVNSRRAPLARTETEDREHAAYHSLRRDTLLAAAFTLPVVVLGMLPMFPAFRAWWPLDPARHNLLLLILTAPVMFPAGRRFFTAAWKAARHRTADMNTLVAVGTASAFGYSAFLTLRPETYGAPVEVYFDTAAVIVTLVLVGRLLESRAR